jgi:putrescine transport system ATP-binding protein
MVEQAARSGPVESVEARLPPVPLLRIEAVEKRFGGVRAVDELSLEIGAGEFFALLGPSGCGKTTLLRMLAGFEAPDRGRILLDGLDIAAMLPHQRPVNMMFQNYALFPHLSVAGNVAFGLRQESLSRKEISQRVEEMLALVKLEGLGKRKPHQLSGGQRQRVALARALAREPHLLLLDDATSSVDPATEARILTGLGRVLSGTVLMVASRPSTISLADDVLFLEEGRVAGYGSHRALFAGQPGYRRLVESYERERAER